MEFTEPFTKGSFKVDVNINDEDDDGFHGPYVATVVDIMHVDASTTKKTRSSNKKKKNTKDKKKVGYLVKYDTLYQEDNLTETLTEMVHPSSVRPLPPQNGDGGGEFEVSDVVDAYLKDGWWIGVVKKVNVGEGEMMMRQYVVEFENPPEEAEFVGDQMRLHVDWVDSTWKQRSQKVTDAETIGSLDGSAKFSTTRRVVKVDDDEEELHEILLSSAGLENSGSKGNTEEMVSMMEASAAKAKYQDSLLLEQETIVKISNVETIGALDGSAKYRRTRRVVNVDDDDDDEELHEIFISSAGVENSGSKGNIEEMVSMMEISGAQAKDQDSLLLEQNMIIKETSETRGGNSQLKRKRRRPSKLPSRSPMPTASLEDDQEAGKRGSSVIYEITNELDEQPLSAWYQGLHPLCVSKKNSCNTTMVNDGHDETIAASDPTMVNDGQTTENDHILPFVKRSPIWAFIESLELYQNLSQKPHFLPLWKNKEDCREGLAIAHKVTFTNLVQRTTNLQWTDPNHIFTNSLETLVELEDNGFDVGPVRVRLDELLAKKDEAGRLEGEMKEAEKEVEKHNREKIAIDEEINGYERLMKEVEEMMLRAVAMKNVKDEEVKLVRSKLQVVSKRIADWKLAFEELVRNPL